MERWSKKAICVLKALLGAYITTAIFLVVLSFLLYKFNLNEKSVNVGIIVIYIISNFVGGFLVGKMLQNRKFAWGIALGALYYLLLVLISLALYHSLHGDAGNLVTAAVMCLGGGMAGGMLS